VATTLRLFIRTPFSLSLSRSNPKIRGMALLFHPIEAAAMLYQNATPSFSNPGLAKPPGPYDPRFWWTAAGVFVAIPAFPIIVGDYRSELGYLAAVPCLITAALAIFTAFKVGRHPVWRYRFGATGALVGGIGLGLAIACSGAHLLSNALDSTQDAADRST
jgi:hypothetical protein